MDMDGTVERSLIDALTRLEARLDRLEAKVDDLSASTASLRAAAARLPIVADAAGATAQFVWDELAADGIDPIATGTRAATLARQAARPEMLALAERLVQKSGDLTFVLNTVDALDAKLVEAGTSRQAVTDRAIGLAARLAGRMDDVSFALDSLDQLDARLKAAGLSRQALVQQGLDVAASDVAAKATQALVETRREPIQPAGLFAALKAIGDPDLQRALGFALAIGRRFGALLGR
jgi:hypothetical protein